MLLFIHGLLQVPRGAVVRASLGPDAVAPDLPGYGERADAGHVSLDAAVAGLVDLLGAGTADLAGHSIGGAIAMLLAHRHPARIRSVTMIEGNFTPRDAFWSRELSEMSVAAIDERLRGWRRNPADWLAEQGVARDPRRVAEALDGLEAQSAATVQAMARSTVEHTFAPGYLEIIREVLDRVPVHLVAGARSAAAWDVPAFVRAAAASDTVVPDVGHLLWTDDAVAAGRAIQRVLA